MLLKHIVVGWHRGGLGYAGQFLEGCGKSVGYTFGPDFTRSQMEEKLEQAREIEVSPWLVPYLGHPLLKDVPVTFLLRDPMRVFNSLKHLGHYGVSWKATTGGCCLSNRLAQACQTACTELKATAGRGVSLFRCVAFWVQCSFCPLLGAHGERVGNLPGVHARSFAGKSARTDAAAFKEDGLHVQYTGSVRWPSAFHEH